MDRITIALVTILTSACAPDSHSRNSGAGGEQRAETDALGQWLVGVQQHQRQFSVMEQAELAIGLLFSAHKNPAIGVAQCVAMLLEHQRDEEST